MCNACGFYCCASDAFEGCGCDCPEIDCLMERCGGCGARFASALGEGCDCFPDHDYWPEEETA